MWLNLDRYPAAEIEEADVSDDPEVPAAVEYGVLYLVSAFPIIIGISVVLILFYNSLHWKFCHFCIFLINSQLHTSSNMPSFMDPQESDHEAFIEVTMNTPKLLLKKESLGSEKQISVDPISRKETNELPIPYPQPQPLTIPKKIFSFSLPNSTTSSPDFSKKNKYCKNQISQLPSPLSSTIHLARHHSVALTNLERLKELHLRRSKSCGEGRASAPPEEFDIWFTPNSTLKDQPAEDNNKFNKDSLFPEAEISSRNDEIYNKKMLEGQNQDEEKFKCGALCLFIPGLGKGIKHIRSGRRQVSGISSVDVGPHVVSRTVSLEKFECGSWTSSAIINDVGDATSNMFFDLPMELIRCSNVNDDTLSPVTTAFVFDKEVKGVLKNTTTITTPRKSHESARHVRFSTSSPTSYPPSPTSCITPQLLLAREDFTTFLEAQSA
ncbi:hypothetical protein K7X08_033560 [Anisodus acutangulus]|uniref:Uncharacterized protein n=1 Tax=Anisodus acutangulus TaxID=402998 RepID=A0A9Q1M2A2_9SOLA|nr:hypothetical protein K7X08_033560 [Anisodus acutangulus]